MVADGCEACAGAYVEDAELHGVVWDRGKIGIGSSNLSAWLRQEGFYYDEGLYYKSDGNVLDVCDKRYIREYIEEVS